MKIETLNRDVYTREGWDGFRADVRRRVERALPERSKAQEGIVMAHLVMTRDPATLAPFQSPGQALVFTRFVGKTDEELAAVKNDFAWLLRQLSVAGDCIASAFVSEGWITVRERVADDTDFYSGPQIGERRECTFVVWGHRTFGSGSSLARIKRRGKTRSCGPWEDGEEQSPRETQIEQAAQWAGLTGGRFGSFVVPPVIRDNPEAWAQASRLALLALSEREEKGAMFAIKPPEQGAKS